MKLGCHYHAETMYYERPRGPILNDFDLSLSEGSDPIRSCRDGVGAIDFAACHFSGSTPSFNFAALFVFVV